MSQSRPPPPILTQAQQRHLMVSLGHLETMLADVERLVSGGSEAGPRLVRYLGDMPPRYGDDFAPRLAAVREGMARLADTFGLEGIERSRRRAVGALLHSCIVVLEDTGARSFRAYGSVDPGLASVLDPTLQRLREALLEAVGRLTLDSSTLPTDED